MTGSDPAHRLDVSRWLLGIALALPIALVVGVVIAATVLRVQPAGPLPLVSVAAPAADSADCRRLMAALPEELDGQLVRRQLAEPAPAGTAGWGDPPVVLRCGLSRPAELTITARLLTVSGVSFLRLAAAGMTSWVTVDRPVYVAVTLPAEVGSGPLQQLAEVIAGTLPPQDNPPP